MLLGGVILVSRASAQTVSLDPARWTASDSLRAENWHGTPSLWIDRGIGVTRGIDFINGAIDVDVMFDSASNNVGIVFHVRDRNAYETIFFRPGASGTTDAVQYAPGLNGLGATWQIYNGPDAQAAATLVRDRWMHVTIRIHGDSADLYLDHATKPTLQVPRLALAGDAGTEVGVWTGAFGKGAHWANLTLTPDGTPHPHVVAKVAPGTIMDWDLSPVFDASTQHPGQLPALSTMQWSHVKAEPPGMVLISRYRAASFIGAPSAFPDSIVHDRVPGSKVVYLRTNIDAASAGPRIMRIGFSDAATVFCNGVPLYAGNRAAYLNDLGYFTLYGDAIYLPLRAGRNEIVVAVTEFFGGWAFAGRLD